MFRAVDAEVIVVYEVVLLPVVLRAKIASAKHLFGIQYLQPGYFFCRVLRTSK